MLVAALPPEDLGGLLRLLPFARGNPGAGSPPSEIEGGSTPDFSALFSGLLLTSASRDGEQDDHRLPQGREERELLFSALDVAYGWSTGQIGGCQPPVSTWHSAPAEEPPASVSAHGHGISAAVVLPMPSSPTAGVEHAATPVGEVEVSSLLLRAAPEENLPRPLGHEPPLVSTLLAPVPSQTSERMTSPATYTEHTASSQAGSGLFLSFLPPGGETKDETAGVAVGQGQVQDTQEPSLLAREAPHEVRPALIREEENSVLVESIPLNPTVKERSVPFSFNGPSQFSTSSQRTGQERPSDSPTAPSTVQTDGPPLRLAGENPKQGSGAAQPSASSSRGAMEPESEGKLHVPLPRKEPFRPLPVAAFSLAAEEEMGTAAERIVGQGVEERRGAKAEHLLGTSVPAHARAQDFSAPISRPPALIPRVPSESWQALVGRIAGEISSHVRHNLHEAFLQLEPPELGQLRIDLVLEGDTVQARIVAEVAEVGALLRTHLPELREALQYHSLTLGEVRVDIGGWSGERGELPQSFPRESGTREEQGPRTTVRGPRSTATERVHRDPGSGISVWA
jgi:flagellar hook-length control protein FliK